MGVLVLSLSFVIGTFSSEFRAAMFCAGFGFSFFAGVHNFYVLCFAATVKCEKKSKNHK